MKFPPASIAGGIPALKALSRVFCSMGFMPTGGFSAGNFAWYESVLACGGSWLTSPDAIADGDYDRVTAPAADSAGIAKRSRGI